MKKSIEISLAVCIFALAIYFRFTGLDWDEGHLLHPDERFLVMVEGALKWVASFRDYFDTAQSTMNPHNQGFGFYVYGTLPIFIIKALSSMHSQAHELPLHMYGRYFSTVCDLGTVLLVYAMARALKGRWTALLAMFLSACSVLQIQHAHFGVVDSSLAFLVTTCVALAVCLSKTAAEDFWKALGISILFGFFAGCAVATKLSAVLVSGLLVPALLMRSRSIRDFLLYSTGSVAVGLIALRLFQPYAFQGPGLFDVALNPKWVANIQELRNQAQLSVHFPPAVQWFGRGPFFGIENMVVWGLGLPVGITTLVFLCFCWVRIVRRKDAGLLVLLTWISAGLVVFGLIPQVVSLRYLLPLYPSLYVMIAAAVGALSAQVRSHSWRGWCVAGLLLVLVLTPVAWAHAFVGIYMRPHSRVAASWWILTHVPGPVSLQGTTVSGAPMLPVSLPGSALTVMASRPLTTTFSVPERLDLERVVLPKVEMSAEAPVSSGLLTVTVEAAHPEDCRQPSASAPVAAGRIELPISCILLPGEQYRLRIEINESTPEVRIGRVKIAHETSWDDGLPLRVRGYDPYGGIYDGDLNFEMYWDENEAKVERLASILAKADFIFMTSNRQWGSIGRLTERYPVAQQFYRTLLSCDPFMSVFPCYADAVAPRAGGFGFELVATMTSYPRVDGLEINDQYAEEAFTVYDHPKVMIFQKKQQFSEVRIRAALDAGLEQSRK